MTDKSIQDMMPDLEEIDGKKIQWEPRLFMDYVRPAGWLERDTSCHGLFFYYLQARLAYENIIKDPAFLEGHLDPEINLKQLFTSIARMYGTTPEKMVKFWSNVSMQCLALKLPELPDRYKFNSKIEIETNG